MSDPHIVLAKERDKLRAENESLILALANVKANNIYLAKICDQYKDTAIKMDVKMTTMFSALINTIRHTSTGPYTEQRSNVLNKYLREILAVIEKKP